MVALFQNIQFEPVLLSLGISWITVFRCCDRPYFLDASHTTLRL